MAKFILLYLYTMMAIFIIVFIVMILQSTSYDQTLFTKIAMIIIKFICTVIPSCILIISGLLTLEFLMPNLYNKVFDKH